MKNTISIAIFEKNKIYQEQLSTFLNSQNEFQVVCAAENSSELIARSSLTSIDVVIINLTFPFHSMLETIREIRNRFLEKVKIIVCNIPTSQSIITQLKAIGADILLNSQSLSEDLIEAITEPLQSNRKPILTGLSVCTTNPKSSAPALTRRESEICQLICKGKSCPEIASLFHISIRTVENHKANIFRKFDVGSVTQMMEKAIVSGYYYL